MAPMANGSNVLKCFTKCRYRDSSLIRQRPAAYMLATIGPQTLFLYRMPPYTLTTNTYTLTLTT